MKRSYYVLFWVVLSVIVGIASFMPFSSIPYQLTLVKDSGDEAILTGINITGSIQNYLQDDYYHWQSKDGKDFILQKLQTINYLSMNRHENATMQQFPIWNRPDLRGASGVRLPDGREWWVRAEHANHSEFRYVMYWVDTQQHTYEQAELLIESGMDRPSPIIQVAVNGNQVDLLVNMYEDVNGQELISWYSIDSTNRTVRHVKDWTTSGQGIVEGIRGFNEYPEQRLVFLNNNAMDDRIMTIINPVLNSEEEVLLSIYLDANSYASVHILADIIYLGIRVGEQLTTMRYDEGRRWFEESPKDFLANYLSEGYVRNGYLYQPYEDDEVQRIEVVELATGNVVYSGHFVVEGPEGTIVDIHELE